MFVMKKWSIMPLALVLGLGALQAQDAGTDRFPHKMGNLHMSKSFANFDYLKDTEARTDTLLIYNAMDSSMKISFEKPPAYLICQVTPNPLPAGKEGMILITYDAVAQGDYGFQNYRLGLRTNDAQQMIKTFSVRAYIEEDFSKLTEEERQNPPVMSIETETHDFGTVQEGTKVTYDFKFKNTGKRDLIIRKTKATCGCTATHPEKSLLKPGEESYFTVVFDTRGRTGAQHKSVFIYSNDPRHSTAAIHIKGNILAP